MSKQMASNLLAMASNLHSVSKNPVPRLYKTLVYRSDSSLPPGNAKILPKHSRSLHPGHADPDAGAPSSVLVTTSKALVTRSDALVPNSFLFLVVRPRAPSSVLAPSSDALCS